MLCNNQHYFLQKTHDSYIYDLAIHPSKKIVPKLAPQDYINQLLT